MFSPTVWEHFHQPQNRGVLQDATSEGWAGSLERSRFMRVRLRLQEGRIEAASFQTYGCVPVIACGSYLTSWVIGKTPELALSLDASTLESLLGGLPPDKTFCAELAVAALRQALQNHRKGE